MQRVEKVIDEASKLSCTTVISFEPENIFYLTGFWGEGIVVARDGYARLIVPMLEADRARSTARCEVVESERGKGMLEKALSSIEDNEHVCTDCNDYSIIERMKARLTVKYSRDVFYNARMIKDGEEISTIRKAASILDELFKLCEQMIRIGVTEREVQAMLLYEAMRIGAYPPSYRYTLTPLIIASGINSSLPHAEATDKGIRHGELVTVDLTLRYRGYIADATRTYAVGRVDDEMSRVYNVVKEAEERAIDSIASNHGCREIDFIARSYIDSRGYGSMFIHSTGHGIGLEVHEPPWISQRSEHILKDGMTVTIEPGIYLAGRFGVRIEDSVLIWNGDAEILNRYPKDLIVL
jgi:Xaa-Pro aminopeptidase